MPERCEPCNQPKICGEKFNAIYDLIAQNKEVNELMLKQFSDSMLDKFKVLHYRVDRFDKVNEILAQLTEILNQQREDNKRRDEMLAKQSENLVTMGTTIAKLSDKVEETSYGVSELKYDFDETRKSNSILLSDIGKKIVDMVIGAIVTLILGLAFARANGII